MYVRCTLYTDLRKKYIIDGIIKKEEINEMAHTSQSQGMVEWKWAVGVMGNKWITDYR